MSNINAATNAGAVPSDTATEAARARVALMSRRHCHACDLAREDVRRVCAGLGVRWTEHDVDTDPRLCAEYGDRVPVILVDGAEHACWGVEESRLRDALLACDAPR